MFRGRARGSGRDPVSANCDQMISPCGTAGGRLDTVAGDKLTATD